MIDTSILNAQSNPGGELPWIRMTLPDEGFSLDVRCADEKVNRLYALASEYYWRPHKLNIDIEGHSEDLSERILAASYAHGGIIVGSTTATLEHFTEDEWEAWLLRDRERFRIIRSYCEVQSNFVASGESTDADTASSEDSQSNIAQPD